MVKESGRETADGAPRRAERTARGRNGAALIHNAMGHPGLAGVSTVGLAAGRTRPDSFGSA